MLYLISIGIALTLLVLVTIYGKSMDDHMLLLLVVIVMSSAGYYALALSPNLEDALRSNKLSYLAGCFAPMLALIIICNICRLQIPMPVRLVMYSGQIVIYLFVCTIGYLPIYYKSAEYHRNSAGAFLVKVYGPMHTVQVVSMILYTLAGILIGLYSLNRRSVVSRFNVYALLLSDVIAVCVYLVERAVHLEIELLPLTFTLASVVYTVLLIRISNFSIYSAQGAPDFANQNLGSIFFNRDLRYMGCSDYAAELFPELMQWELEKKIPGNGGRFNTFLRQPLLNYMKAEKYDESLNKTFEYKGEAYHFEISAIHPSGKRADGYLIQVSNVTDAVKRTNR